MQPWPEWRVFQLCRRLLRTPSSWSKEGFCGRLQEEVEVCIGHPTFIDGVQGKIVDGNGACLSFGNQCLHPQLL